MRNKTVIAVSLSLLALAGCGLFPTSEVIREGVVDAGLSRPAAAPVDVGVDWRWRVSGDAAVRPVQVFTVKGLTYLQMGITRPAVVVLANGEVIPFRHAPPYILVQGVPDRIDIVIEGYRAVVERIAPPVKAPDGAPPPPKGSDRIERVLIP